MYLVRHGARVCVPGAFNSLVTHCASLTHIIITFLQVSNILHLVRSVYINVCFVWGISTLRSAKNYNSRANAVKKVKK